MSVLAPTLQSAALGAEAIRIARFGCVGLSGVALNYAALWLLTDVAHVYYLLSAAVATEIAIVSNFALNHAWTFRALRDSESFGAKLAKFNAVALGGLTISLIALWALTQLGGLHYLPANLAAIASATAWNYAANRRWTWASAPVTVGV